MAKITFIGAGSLGFTRGLVRDMLTFPLLKDATLTLMDINAERLDFAQRAVQKIIDLGNYPARVEATMDREEALKGADAVMCTILAGGTDVWQYDITIPKEYGVDTNIGDTRGPSGVFRALRTIPVMLSIVKDMEKQCPDAILLNYTNPMAMLCRAMQRESFIRLTGLCHSVQGTAMMLARWIGAPYEEVTYTCAGINHQAWYLDYEWNGGHNSEYNWWFRKRPDLIEKYCTHGTGWNPGEYAYILKQYRSREDSWREEAKKWFAQDTPISLKRGHEYAASIINARMGGEIFHFNGNMPNTNLITNLPEGACVEVPIFVDKAGFHPVHVGTLPPQLVTLNHISVMIEEMAVEACLTGDPTMVLRAIAYDPLTASVLSLAEIKDMVNKMLKQNQDYLPTFKHFEA